MKKGFPVEILNPTQRALCLFCAAFGGAQDVKPLHEAGIRDILLNDNDIHKLTEVAGKYKTRWWFRDAFETIDLLIKSKENFDVITSDQWSGQDKLIHEDYFNKLYSIANEYLILGIGKLYLDTLDKWPEGEYYLRSGHNGGTYWRVIKKK